MTFPILFIFIFYISEVIEFSILFIFIFYFSEVIEDLYKAGIETGDKHPKIDEAFYQVVKNNEDILNSAIIYDRDFSYSFAAMKVCETLSLKS